MFKWLVGLALAGSGFFAWTQRKDKLAGGLGDAYVKSGTLPLGVSASEVKRGIKVEMEHTKDATLAREIAIDHLVEDSKYYDKLEKAGL